ncbi:hypothetical protein WR25_15641 isoform E [Diploscapter pachys]|uniref:RUN domain-containing protein n=1 Tax=Diploscapter pachys TaxID=2018661 RepID=A0A2A2KUV5_9BILA|nr:hypothetical protein WR25_15641 isoform E [Diploscapter pachys]
MFQLSAVTLKPEVRASRSQHGPFQEKIAALVDKVLKEREIVDMENENGKMLFNSMDTFFSYGLLSGDRVYWRFVKEFLPKTEQAMLKAEWGGVNNRRMSIAWLKSAFNKGTLHFQMLSFKTNKSLIYRYYHQNACMSNMGMLEAVTDLMEKLIQVQFAFYSTLKLRQEPMPAVVVASPVTPQVKIPRRRRITENDRNEAPTPNRLPPNSSVPNIAASIDQEVLLDELIRNRKMRQMGMSNAPEQSETSPSPPVLQIEHPQPEERLDDVLRKTLSQVRMEYLSEEPKSFDSLLHYDEVESKIKAPEVEPLTEGELVIHPGDILQLAMDVFVERGEKFHKMFHVYDRFGVGTPVQRLLAITNYHMYVLSQTVSVDDSSLLGSLEEGVQSTTSYHIHAVMPYSIIDYIAVSVDMQVIVVYAKADQNFTVEEKMIDNRSMFQTGEAQLGEAILKAIKEGATIGEHTAPVILTESTPYTLILKRYLAREIPSAPSNEVEYMALMFWKECSADVSHRGDELSGYIYKRSVFPNRWRKGQNEWTQRFMVSRGTKIYVYIDSSCKEGDYVIDLSQCSEITECDEKTAQWACQLTKGDELIQLQCGSREALYKWMQRISIAICSQAQGSDEAVASILLITETHAVICQEGDKCYNDGFVRTLLVFNLTEIKCGWTVRCEQHAALVLHVEGFLQCFFFRLNLFLFLRTFYN